MEDKRSFIQFPHPGSEHEPDSNDRISWNRDDSKRKHKRKFMQLCGEWINSTGSRHTGELRAWGEWEPESTVLRRFNNSEPYGPRYLWDPYYIERESYKGLYNTDPFIFGERFLYSNCHQKKTSNCGMKHLARGSVIAFGSTKDGRYMLDTVFVVKSYCDYQESEAIEMLQDCTPAAFLAATARPIADGGGKGHLRLYFGATPDDPVSKMFSFFPAIAAGSESSSSFPRPFITLRREHFNPKSQRVPKGRGREVAMGRLYHLWDSLVEQVYSAGLVLGTRAEPPECRT